MRIVIVEDHVMFRDALRKACHGQFGHEVVGETGSGVEAVELILRQRPEVVVLDLSLPDMDGFNVVERVFKSMPHLRILVLSAHCDDYTLFRVDQTGVHGFIDKNSNTIATLKEALTAVSEGRNYFSAPFQQARQARRTDPNSFVKLLTEWERAVLSLIARGMTDDEVGECLSISPRTVQTHRSNMLRKLQLRGTPKLIAFGIEHGFTQIQAKRGSTPVFP